MLNLKPYFHEPAGFLQLDVPKKKDYGRDSKKVLRVPATK